MEDDKKSPMLDENQKREPDRLDVEKEEQGQDGVEQAEDEVAESDEQR